MDNEQGAVEWRDAWQRVWQVVGQHGVEAERTVPACPAWTVRQVEERAGRRPLCLSGYGTRPRALARHSSARRA